MRNLELNKTNVWYVDCIGETNVLDDEGYDTGEKEPIYSVPIPTRLILYPATGEVLEESFGVTSKIDMVTVSDIKLKPQSLIFLSEPISNYDLTYDFKVSKILPSLNHTQYGLRGRI